MAQIVLTGVFHGVYTLSSCSVYQRVPACLLVSFKTLIKTELFVKAFYKQ